MSEASVRDPSHCFRGATEGFEGAEDLNPPRLPSTALLQQCGTHSRLCGRRQRLQCPIHRIASEVRQRDSRVRKISTHPACHLPRCCSGAAHTVACAADVEALVRYASHGCRGATDGFESAEDVLRDCSGSVAFLSLCGREVTECGRLPRWSTASVVWLQQWDGCVTCRSDRCEDTLTIGY